MSEEEKNEEIEAVSAEDTAGDTPAEETAAAGEGEVEAEEAAAEATEGEAEPEQTAAETTVSEAEAEEAAEGEVEADQAAAEATEDVAAAETTAKKSDLPPGADLEPISIEPEAELSAEERARLEAEEEERAQREAEAEQQDDDAPLDDRKPVKLDKNARFIATGKRKRSVARVIVLAGEGKITVNDREIEEYFPRARHRTVIGSPLVVTGYESAVDIQVRVHGGGISGQAGAIRHGIARALTGADPELRSELKRRGFLTRDARAKERHKAGFKKARKRPQFSKR